MDVENLAQVLHEAGREAVEKRLLVRTDVPVHPFVEWPDLTEEAREGRRVQARYLLERFNITEKAAETVQGESLAFAAPLKPLAFAELPEPLAFVAPPLLEGICGPLPHPTSIHISYPEPPSSPPIEPLRAAVAVFEQKPSPGRIVHFVLPNGAHRPAIITSVGRSIGVELTVFLAIGDSEVDPQCAHWIKAGVQEDPTGEKEGTWHWPERV